QASVSIPTTTASGSFDVDLVNSDGSYGRKLSAFQVLAATLPGIAAVTPADGATNVAVTVRPTVSFSEAMNAASITSASVRILGPGGSPVSQGAGSPSLDAS